MLNIETIKNERSYPIRKLMKIAEQGINFSIAFDEIERRGKNKYIKNYFLRKNISFEYHRLLEEKNSLGDNEIEKHAEISNIMTGIREGLKIIQNVATKRLSPAHLDGRNEDFNYNEYLYSYTQCYRNLLRTDLRDKIFDYEAIKPIKTDKENKVNSQIIEGLKICLFFCGGNEKDKKISFNKIAFQNKRKTNLVELTLGLSEPKIFKVYNKKAVYLEPQGLGFSASGTVWNHIKTDCIMAGQCIDNIPSDQIENKELFYKIMDIWKKFHLKTFLYHNPKDNKIPLSAFEEINNLLK